MQDSKVDQGSFRDRNGRVFYSKGEVYRGVSEGAYGEWKNLNSKPFFTPLVEQGRIVKTEEVPVDSVSIPGSWNAVLKHQKIPFISYPYEWSFSMLKDAALLQLELLEKGLAEEIILKDASSYNVQWIGANPIFIDIPSFHSLKPGEPWVGYKQFCQLFLYPLLLQAHKNIPFHPLLRGSIDGIESEQCHNMFSLADHLKPGVFLNVCLQSKLQSKFSSSNKPVKQDLSKAGFSKEMILVNVRRLKKLVSRLEWKDKKSEWSDYAKEHSYNESQDSIKKTFVKEVTDSKKWNLVWDLGCNTGTYSRIAAESANYVIAMDSDHLAIERMYLQLKKEGNKKILPLLNNIGDPSPNLGWRGAERKSLPGRGKPDLVLALALIHHLVISSNIPTEEVVDWLASLGSSLIIEFVSKDDEMVKILLNNKEDQYQDYEQDKFEQYLQKHFTIRKKQSLKKSGVNRPFLTI